MGSEITPAAPMTKAQAKRVTTAIRQTADDLWHLLREAHDGQAWAALGYATWGAYVEAEFDMTRRNANLLVAQGKVIAAIEAATPAGTAGRALPAVPPVSARQAAQIKKAPGALRAIKAAVKAGVAPVAAVKAALAEHSAAKPEQLTIPWAVPHSQDAARLAHDDIAAKLGIGKAKSFLRDEITRLDGLSGFTGPTQGLVAAARLGLGILANCAHPKPWNVSKTSGQTRCAKCGMVRGARDGVWRAP